MKLSFLLLICFCCTWGYSVALNKDDPEVDRLITKYWLQYKRIAVILVYLRVVHRVTVGMTWLKKRLQVLCLHRRGSLVTYSPVKDIQRAIQKEREEGNNNIGYRQMRTVLKQKYNLVVKRSTVQMLLSTMDPEGAERRRARRLKRRVYQNKGPDFVWHMDGYDKLKPYGFCIHACIDGYSRRIIWLHLSSTNNDPRVILQYYLLSTLQCNGCPTIIRTDCGTENTEVAACHMSMRHNHTDQFNGEKSVRYGASTTNTRIESWWAQLRNSVTDFWINLLKDMVQQGMYDPQNLTHRHCLTYVYEPLLQRALEEFKVRWNTHYIRSNKLAGCPSGVPDDLYNLPILSGTTSYRKALDFDVWAHCYVEVAYCPDPFFPPEFENAADAILHSINSSRDEITHTNATVIYQYLVSIISDN